MLSRRIAVIYCVTNTLNGKQYVGVTSKTSALRWKEHCWKALRNPATEFHYSLDKHGPEQQIKFQTAGHTPETIWKAARAKDKPVECVSLNVIFDSMLDAARDTGVHFSNVARCAAGKRKTAGGLVFRYI